jgi:hypothetical protein
MPLRNDIAVTLRRKAAFVDHADANYEKLLKVLALLMTNETFNEGDVGRNKVL